MELMMESKVKKGYQQTEVGLIPEDWGVKSLNDISDKIMVGIASAATHAYRNSGIILFRNQNIKSNFLDDSDILYVSLEYEEQFKGKRLEGGDLLTARTGYPGTTCIVPDKYKGSQSFTTLITRPKKASLDSLFLCYYMNSESGQSFFDANQIGGGQKNVNVATLKTMPIPIPPSKKEQKAIAQVLSDTDALIQSLEKQIGKKRLIKQGAMQELLRPRAGWEVRKFSEIAKQIVGGGTPSRANPLFWGNEIPWVTVKDFTTFNPFSSQEYITKLGLNNSASNLIKKGTLITSTRMALGKAIIYKVDVCINQDLKAIVVNNNITTEFLFYWFEFNSKYIEELGSGSTVMGISLPDLKKIKVDLPPLSKQTRIATILSDMDAELSVLEKKLSKYKELKQGLMQQLLTGKIRLV